MEPRVKYLEEYKRLHLKKESFSGSATFEYKYDIGKLIESTDSETLLDYGCGKAVHYKNFGYDLFWGVEVDCFDPAIDEFNTLHDKKYDGVICVYVMEHVPEEEVDQVLKDIFDRAEKFVFLAIANHVSGKKFEDGQQIHVTMEDQAWWQAKVDEHNTNNVLVDLRVTYSDRCETIGRRTDD